MPNGLINCPGKDNRPLSACWRDQKRWLRLAPPGPFKCASPPIKLAWILRQPNKRPCNPKHYRPQKTMAGRANRLNNYGSLFMQLACQKAVLHALSK